MQSLPLFYRTINSPLGTLYALANQQALLYLGFEDLAIAAQKNL